MLLQRTSFQFERRARPKKLAIEKEKRLVHSDRHQVSILTPFLQPIRALCLLVKPFWPVIRVAGYLLPKREDKKDGCCVNNRSRVETFRPADIARASIIELDSFGSN